MNIRLLTILGLCLATGLQAQAQAPADDTTAAKRSTDELLELLGPIALYPDPLIALVLPAASVPSDIVLADRFVGSGADVATVDDKPWDSSVKALTHYPDTLKWLDDNLDWTSQVGDAFVSQPVDVMEAIQALRAKAKSVGNLVDTPQETIVQDDDGIRIVPAQADAIYVPTYDSEVIYERHVEVVEFSEPYIVGPWLGYHWDWHHHHIYCGEWHHGWDYSRGHDREVYLDTRVRNTRVWHVDPKRRLAEIHHPIHVVSGGHPVIPHPKHVTHLPAGAETIKGTHGEIIKGGKGHLVMPTGKAPGIHGEEHKREEEHKVAEHKAEEHKGAVHNEERKIVHAEEHKAAVHNEERKVVHAEEHKAAVHNEERKIVHGEEHKAAAVHVEDHHPRVEEHKAAAHIEEHKAAHVEEHHEASKGHSDPRKKDEKKREP